MRRRWLSAIPLAAAGLLVLPGSAFAQEGGALETVKGELDVTWVIVAGILVMFMQAGFAFLEIGFSRGKNVGAGIAKILANFSLASIAWWAVGFGVAFGGAGWLAGDAGFLFSHGEGLELLPGAGGDAAFLFFQFMFCAVSLAIVWGTTLERIKFVAYVVYAIVFAAVIYPIGAHWIFGGGLLSDVGGKPVMDFAGSTVVHLVGATGAFAALLLLGPRIGKYGADGKPRAIPGHSMPLVGLGILILWLGWFGFNPGSTLGTTDAAFAEVALNTQLAAAAGVIAASLVVYLRTSSLDVGMAGNGAIAGLVGITAPSGFVEFWAAPIIGAVAGTIVVFGVLAIEKVLDDPVGALSAHGLAGIWGTLSVGIFGSERLILDGASPGLWYGVIDGDIAFAATLGQFGVQAVGVGLAFTVVMTLSYATFYAIKQTVGLRVSQEEELAGLDISSHGMYGYPEQFIPQEEYPTTTIEPKVAGTPVAAPVPAQRPTST